MLCHINITTMPVSLNSAACKLQTRMFCVFMSNAWKCAARLHGISQ